MQVKSYTATGPQFSELEAALTERFTPEESHTGDGFAVLMIEEYEFWRTNSNMQVTIILESSSENSCLVKLTVGGGASGIFNWTYGSEEKALQKITREIEEVFDEFGMTAEGDS